eukprot:scaffold11462_cov68-Phaeocystis_antarctica.AAC.4
MLPDPPTEEEKQRLAAAGATAQSALGWYRPSVGVPETFDGRPSGVLVYLFSVQFSSAEP